MRLCHSKTTSDGDPKIPWRRFTWVKINY